MVHVASSYRRWRRCFEVSVVLQGVYGVTQTRLQISRKLVITYEDLCGCLRYQWHNRKLFVTDKISFIGRLTFWFLISEGINLGLGFSFRYNKSVQVLFSFMRKIYRLDRSYAVVVQNCGLLLCSRVSGWGMLADALNWLANGVTCEVHIVLVCSWSVCFGYWHRVLVPKLRR